MPNQLVEGLVSTIIPVYNREMMIQRAVDSVLAQHYRPIEIIIVNDGSTDNTASVCDELALKHPEIIRVLHQCNRGVAMAREAGRQVIRGEYVQYLDSDDLLLPLRFKKLIAALSSNPDCGIAYDRTSYVDQDGQSITDVNRSTDKQQDFLFPKILNVRWWATATPLFRRTVIDKAGPWLNLRTCEDWEYDARIGASNTKLCWVNEPLSTIYRHESDHLSSQWLDGPSRFVWASAMLKHAKSAGMKRDDTEYIKFRKYLRLLARQYWQRGDNKWARSLYKLSMQDGDRSIFNRAYLLIANTLGKPFVDMTEWLYRLKNSTK